MIAESRRGGDSNRAAGGDFDGRIDDVLFPIAFAGRNIARHRVARQGRDGNVVSPPDATLKHAAAPYGYVAGEAQSLDLASARMTADTAQLDVDDAGSPEVQSGFRITDVANRFVEANRSLQLLLELCMIGDVVPPERLLHHQEVKFVEALEKVRVSQCVGGIRINGQKNAGMGDADGAHNFKIFARFDLEFDALIAIVKLKGDFFEKHFGSGLQP